MAATHAERLPRAGIAVLTFDKRGTGESAGHWRTQTLAHYAADLEGGLAVLKQHPQIDGGRIGVIGHSQGGWTALLAVGKSSVAFLVLIGATPLSPLEQSLYVDGRAMERRRVPPNIARNERRPFRGFNRRRDLALAACTPVRLRRHTCAVECQ